MHQCACIGGVALSEIGVKAQKRKPRIIKKFYNSTIYYTYKKTNISDNKDDIIKFFKNLGAYYTLIRPDFYDKEIQSFFNTL